MTLIFVGLGVLYLMGGLALVGYALGGALQDARPSADPAHALARWMGVIGLGYVLVRLLFERGLDVDPTPYARLPIRHRVLARHLAATAFASIYNVVPFVFVVAFWTQTTGGAGTSVGYFASWGVLLALTTYLVPLVRYALSRRFAWTAAGLLVAVGGVGALFWWGRADGLLNASGWLFGGVIDGRIVPVLVAAGLLAGLAAGYSRTLRTTMRSDAGRRRTSRGAAWTSFDGLVQRGPVWREIALELQIILRNRQPQVSIAMCLVFFPALVVVAVFLEPEMTKENVQNNLITWLLVTGGFIFAHGQRMFTWEGRSTDAFNARPVPSDARVKGKLLFLIAGTVLLFLLPLPALLWTQSGFGILIGAFCIYNAGIMAPLILAGATFMKKPSKLEFTLADTNFAGGHLVILLIAVGGTLLLTNGLLFVGFGLWEMTSVVAVVGVVSLLAFPLWVRGIVALLRYNRYQRMDGFRSSASS